MRTVCAIVLVWLLPVCASADGLAYVVTGGTADVRATEQRAVLWLNDGVWELHLQPVFAREAGAAAWVVPFPVLPEVSQGEAALFDQLEILTAPVFLQTCSIPCCGECLDGGSGADQVDGGQGLVTVWEQGSVGELDYVILSAAGGDDVLGWLDQNGYEVPEPARGPLTTLAQEGAFFFAARLSAEADPAKPLSPVRFRLPDLEAPVYPLRTTAAGVGQGRLGLTLWVVTPPGQLWLPDRFTFDGFDAYVCNPDDYRQALDALFADHTRRFLALTSSRGLEYDLRFHGQAFCTEFGCTDLSTLGVELPDEWAADLQAMVSQGGRLLRFEGRLSASDMAIDLSFEPADDYDLPRSNDTFTCGLGYCFECNDPHADAGSDPGNKGGCSLAAPGSLAVSAGLLLALAVALSLRRRD